MSKTMQRVENIQKKICFIEEIVEEAGGIIKAFEDERCMRASIQMHLISIAREFDMLSNDGEFEVLSKFDKNDLSGNYDVRTFITHYYEGVNLSVIEHVVRDRLPHIKRVVEQILKN